MDHRLVRALIALAVGLLFHPGISTAEEIPREAPPVYGTWHGGMEPDKCASAWLIRRFVDPGATFRFYPKGAPIDDAIPFEVPYGRYLRLPNRSTFETILEEEKIEDPALHAMGRIIHDLEINIWQPRVHPESEGLAAVIRGLSEGSQDDSEVLERSFVVFDGLHASFRSRLGLEEEEEEEEQQQSVSERPPGLSGRILFLAHREGLWDLYEQAVPATPLTTPAAPRRLRRSRKNVEYLAVDPAGKRVAYTDAAGDLHIGPIDDPDRDAVAVPGPGAEQPSWSPDGRRVVFVRFQAVPRDDSDLHVLEVSTRRLRALRPMPGLELDPIWSLDGSSLLVSRHIDRGRRPVAERIWRVPLGTSAGEEVLPLTADDGADRFDLALSRDGRLLAFSCNLEGSYDIWVANPDGSLPHRVTTSPGHEAAPSFSPDGSWLAHEDARDGRQAIRLTEVEGSRTLQLTPAGWRCRRPVWAP